MLSKFNKLFHLDFAVKSTKLGSFKSTSFYSLNTFATRPRGQDQRKREGQDNIPEAQQDKTETSEQWGQEREPGKGERDANQTLNENVRDQQAMKAEAIRRDQGIKDEETLDEAIRRGEVRNQPPRDQGIRDQATQAGERPDPETRVGYGHTANLASVIDNLGVSSVEGVRESWSAERELHSVAEDEFGQNARLRELRDKYKNEFAIAPKGEEKRHLTASSFDPLYRDLVEILEGEKSSATRNLQTEARFDEGEGYADKWRKSFTNRDLWLHTSMTQMLKSIGVDPSIWNKNLEYHTNDPKKLDDCYHIYQLKMMKTSYPDEVKEELKK